MDEFEQAFRDTERQILLDAELEQARALKTPARVAAGVVAVGFLSFLFLAVIGAVALIAKVF